MGEIDWPDEVAEWNGGVHEVGGKVAPPFRIGLKRRGDGTKRPVLLVHGASASSRTFEVAAGGGNGRGTTGGLAAFLVSAGWDVWLLDWRSSGTLSPLLIDPGGLAPERFNLEEAQTDLTAALEQIAKVTGYADRIPVVGHCVGGALVAQAVATAPRDSRIGSVVLTTLGLFFNTGLDDWVKGNERFLENVWLTLHEQGASHDQYFISPWVADAKYGERHGWPKPLEDAYQVWKQTPLTHDCTSEFCRRACFMFGMPYRSTDMSAIHDEAATGGLWQQFGRMPLAAYMHCVQNLRRGWVAPWQADDSDTSYLCADPFGERRVTLITGDENQVWHRDSIDRMYEWLRRELPRAQHAQVVKHVLPRYGHQDLYWSSKAATEVYPKIEAGLYPPH